MPLVLYINWMPLKSYLNAELGIEIPHFNAFSKKSVRSLQIY